MSNDKMKPTPYLEEVNSMWRGLLHLAQIEHVKKGYRWKDEDANTFSFIDKGLIRLESCNEYGEIKRILGYLKSGVIFREVKGFIYGSENIYTATAVKNSIIYHFPMNILESLSFTQEYPEYIHNIYSTITLKTISLFYLLAEESSGSAEERIARYIIRLAEFYKSDIFAPHISQTEFALLVGVHRSTFCKVIKDFKEQGILGEVAKNKIEILNREKLDDYCNILK